MDRFAEAFVTKVTDEAERVVEDFVVEGIGEVEVVVYGIEAAASDAIAFAFDIEVAAGDSGTAEQA